MKRGIKMGRKKNNNKATPVSEIAPLDQVTMEIVARRQKKEPEAILILSASARDRGAGAAASPGTALRAPAAGCRLLFSSAGCSSPRAAPLLRLLFSSGCSPPPPPPPHRPRPQPAPPAVLPPAAQLEFKGAALSGRRCPRRPGPAGCACVSQSFPRARWDRGIRRDTAGEGATRWLCVALGVVDYYRRNSGIQRPQQSSVAKSAVHRHG